MTADDLWEKWLDRDASNVNKFDLFCQILSERDAYVKKECVRVCEEIDCGGIHGGYSLTSTAKDCAAAIEKLEIK